MGRRWKVIATAGAAVVFAGVGIGVAAAGGSASASTISCPSVADKLPAVPASAQAEVSRNLALLNTQIAEANNRLATSAGQGGANFVQNAILGPLADKRTATIDRIAISIGRQGTRPTNLGGLATCSLATAGGGSAPESTQVAVADGANGGAAADGGTIVCPDVESQLPAVPAGAQAEVDRNLALLDTQIAEANTRLDNTVGQGGPNFVQNAILGPLEDKRIATINRIATAIGRINARPQGLDALAPCTLQAAGGDAAQDPAAEDPAAEEPAAEDPVAEDPAAADPGTISCPDVRSQLPAVPAGAQAEVDRNLALLDTQIAEANARLISTVGQGGPNFVQNAILGPLEDKRIATINRIATAIGRINARPVGLDALAPCTLN
ncbi:hypothetical protein GCM10023263_24750 [Phytohabitans rumicis]